MMNFACVENIVSVYCLNKKKLITVMKSMFSCWPLFVTETVFTFLEGLTVCLLFHSFLLKLFPCLLNRFVGFIESSFSCMFVLWLLSALLVLLSLLIGFLPARVTSTQVRFSVLPVSSAIFYLHSWCKFEFEATVFLKI